MKIKLGRLIRLLPGFVLDVIHDSTFAELLRRGDIVFAQHDETFISEYDGFQIKLDVTHTATTWSLYKDDKLLCKPDDRMFSSLSEAEAAAISWIETFEVANNYLTNELSTQTEE
jgi:hypothetical protein